MIETQSAVAPGEEGDRQTAIAAMAPAALRDRVIMAETVSGTVGFAVMPAAEAAAILLTAAPAMAQMEGLEEVEQTTAAAPNSAPLEGPAAGSPAAEAALVAVTKV
jgi:hypothetical protein